MRCVKNLMRVLVVQIKKIFICLQKCYAAQSNLHLKSHIYASASSNPGNSFGIQF